MKLRTLALGIALTFALASCENPVSSDDIKKTPTAPTSPDTPTTPETPPAPDTPPAKPAPKPAFGGYYRADKKTVACYWQDGVRHNLGESLATDSQAMAATAIAGDITYVAGIYQTGTTGDGEAINQPCYWANGTLVDLKGEDGTTALPNGGNTTGIAIANGTVYACGSTGYAGSITAGYWSGTSFHALPLPAGASNASAMSIAASASGDVYIAGHYYKDAETLIPCYWKNGAMQTLSPLAGAIAAYTYDIAISGTDVYVCGVSWMPESPADDSNRARPCYWKNGDCFALDGPNGDKSFPCDEPYARSICVANGVVYTAGYYDGDTDKIPCYWEGSTLHALAGGPASDVYLSAIAVSDGVVSVAGYYKREVPKARVTADRVRTPCYWEGGTFHDLVADTPEGAIPFPDDMVH